MKKNLYYKKIDEQFTKKQYVRELILSYGDLNKKRRALGVHLTSVKIFEKFILPEIKDKLYNYIWIDLFCGEGNLILPMLKMIPKENRNDFFNQHIFLFDIQKEMVEKCIQNAINYGISYKVAQKNIQIRDTLKDYPVFIKELKHPIFHITNPPYLYLGYIVKNEKNHLKYFDGINEGYQDLYQIAMMNDLRNGIKNMIYIIPTNFLFGFSSSNKIRKDFLPIYSIKKAIIFERKIFEWTGTNVCICFFERKNYPSLEPIKFKAIKINNGNNGQQNKMYILQHQNFYRAGGEFDEFVKEYKAINPINVSFYLLLDKVIKNKGNLLVKLLDVNNFSSGCYKIEEYKVNKKLYDKIKQNTLFVRTIDTGKWEGRAGLYFINEIFEVDGIVVSKEKYRTYPIQLFLTPPLSLLDIKLLKNYFNTMLEYFRDITDSEFLTTFKYSNANYVRKYLGLSQVKKLIETYPVYFTKEQKVILKILLEQKNIEEIKNMLYKIKKEKQRNQLKIFN